MRITDGRPYFKNRKHGFFDLLPFLQPGRMLDVGAAVGFYTNLMRTLSPSSPVTAFEPFPGNLKHLQSRFNSDPLVTIIPKAVSDKAGSATFHVASIATGSMAGRWPGFSSVGTLLGTAGTAISVETCTLANTISERVSVAKIDVQGVELEVLRGALPLMREHGIDHLYVEFTGEADLLNFILDAGYAIYTSVFTIFVRKGRTPSGWSIERPLTLSTGRQALQGWPDITPTDASSFCRFFRDHQRKDGSIMTNLVCVHPRALPNLLTVTSEHASS